MLIGEVVGIGDGSPGNVTIYFLFTGDEPLRVTISAPEAISFELVPRVGRPRENERLLPVLTPIAVDPARCRLSGFASAHALRLRQTGIR